MSNPPLTEYKDDGCRYVEYEFIKKDRFDGRSDLMEEAYSDTDSWALYQAFDSSPHKAQLVRILARIDRGGKADLNTLDDVRHQLAEIDGTAVNDPHDLMAYVTGGQVGDALVEEEPTIAPTQSGTNKSSASKSSKSLNPTLIKREQKRISAEQWSRNQYGEGFIENKAFISKAKKMVTDMARAGASRDEVIAATDTIIATYEQDYGLDPLTEAQQDSLRDNVVLKRYDRLYKADMIEQALLDGTTGAKRQVEIKAFALWHQIKRVAVNGETPEIGQNTLLKWVGGSGNTYLEPIELLIKLEAIEEYQPGVKQKSSNPNSPGQAAKYKRLV